MGKREVVNVDEEAIKRMIAGDIPPYLEKEEKKRRSEINADEITSGNTTQKEGREENADNPKTPRRKKVVMDSYRETFLRQPAQGDCRQTTLNIEGKNHFAIKKVIKVADGLSMAGFVNNVLSHHFREHGEEISGIMRSYMSDLYKEEEE